VPLLAPLGIERIVSSPLMRARESADIVGAMLGRDVTTDPGLCEVNFGDWVGWSYDDLLPTAEYQRYRADPVRNPPPAGETLSVVQARGMAALRRALVAANGGRVLLVSHGDLIRCLLCHLLGVELSQYRRLRVDNCSISAADIRNGTPRLLFVNVVADPDRRWLAVDDRAPRPEL
jgi:broad specificity phosphatase PhoE